MEPNRMQSALKRIRNVTSRLSGKKWQQRIQLAGSAASALGIFVAIWVAAQGQVTVDRSSRATLQQSEDAQLSTAITAIGSDSTAEEIAGLVLLTRNTLSRFTLMSQTNESPGDVFQDYRTALQVLSGYLRSHGESFLSGTGAATQGKAAFGLGYGSPPSDGFPIELTYAADQIQIMLDKDMASKVAALNVGVHAAIDLSADELIGQPWGGIHFGWIFAYMVGIDLRGADLAKSQWSSRSDLAGAYLQCADLAGANFRGANLSHADLRGADVQGADFRGARLNGANLTKLYGTATWSRRLKHAPLPTAGWNSDACLRNSRFWHKRPAPSPKG